MDPTTVLDGTLNEVFEALRAVLITTLSAFLLGLLAKAFQYLNTKIDVATSESLHKAIANAIEAAAARGHRVTLDQVMAYVKKTNPDNVSRFGEEKVEVAAQAAISKAVGQVNGMDVQ